MNKLILSFILSITALNADSGEEIYKTKCSMCHMSKPLVSISERDAMREKMKYASQEERIAAKNAMMQKMVEGGMRAPAMEMVSLRLKSKLASKEAFVTFVDDYIQHPSKKKGFCMPRAYQKFGTMPAIGQAMTEEERETVAHWLYDNYKGSWSTSEEAGKCEARNRQSQKEMKCGSAKCGAVKIPTH